MVDRNTIVMYYELPLFASDDCKVSLGSVVAEPAKSQQFDCKQAVLDMLADGQWHALTRRRSPERAVFNCQSRRNKAKSVCTELISEGVIESRIGTNRAIEYRLCSVVPQQPTTVRCLELKSRVEQKIVDFFDRSDLEWIAVRDLVVNVFSAKQDRKAVPVVLDAWLGLGVAEEQHRCNRNRTISRLIRLNPGVEFIPFRTEEPATNAVTVVEPPEAIDLYTRREFRQAAMEVFDRSRMEEALSSIKALLWAQWQGEKWMTTKQVADFLGLTTDAIDKNFQRNRQEFLEAAEVRTLRGVDLKGFRYETDSESVSSKSDLVGKKANAVNIYSVAGVLRMAWMSDGFMGRAVRDFTMKLVHSMPAMIEQGVKLGRDQRLDTMTSSDLAHGVVVERLEGIESKVDQGSLKIDELTDKVDRLESLMAQTHHHAETAAVNSEKAASKSGSRINFTPKEKTQIAICYYLATADGLDLFDGTQLVHSDGTWTQDCEFDHVNANSNVKRLNNCMPFSKQSHRLKGNSALSMEQRERLHRYHMNVLDQLGRLQNPLFSQMFSHSK